MSTGERDDSLDLLSINEVLTGNTDAYSSIVDRYQKSIFHLALSFLGNKNDAEDAVQEIFFKTYRSLNSFTLSRRFHPWIYSIAINHLKSCYRTNQKRQNHKQLEAELEIAEYPNPEKSIEIQYMRETVRQAVNSLPQKLRTVTILYYLEEKKISEIESILNIGNENIKSRLDRARKKLRAFLT